MMEKLVWGSGKETGFLKARTVFDENENPLLSREFTYDKRGNVTEEKLYGESCDEATTKKTFSDDGFNLKLSERDPVGNYTYYEYYENSNLLKAKFSCYKKKIKKREFFSFR
jgi:hypothetical protein